MEIVSIFLNVMTSQAISSGIFLMEFMQFAHKPCAALLKHIRSMTETVIHIHGNFYLEGSSSSQAQPAHTQKTLRANKLYNYLFTLAFWCRKPFSFTVVVCLFIGASLHEYEAKQLA
jgi:hypothetical protein